MFSVLLYRCKCISTCANKETIIMYKGMIGEHYPDV